MKVIHKLIVFGLLIVIHASPAYGQDEAGVYPDRERTYVAGLQTRRMFDIAEAVCVRLLDDERATAGDQIALAIDLVKIRTASARDAAWDQRAVAWDRVHDIGGQFASQFPGHPSEILLQVQLAISHRERAAFLDQELNARMVPASQVPASRQLRLDEARTARRAFEEVLRGISRLMSLQRSGSPADGRLSDGRLSSEQLLSLRSNANYQLALSRMQIADSYAADSTDPANPVAADQLSHVSELREVLRDLQEVQRGVDLNEPLWWQAEISRMQCLRKLKQFGEARQAISSLPKLGVPADLEAQLLDERLLLAIESDDVAAMKAALSSDQLADDAARTPALDISRLRAAVALSGLTAPSEQAAWIETANSLQRRIDQVDGAYWGRLARLALVSESSPVIAAPDVSATPYREAAASVEMLIRTAETSLAAGNTDDALAAFDAAIEQLAGSSKVPAAQNRMFALTIEASKILEGQRQSRLAAGRMMEVALRFPQSPSAPTVHLRGVWNLAQAIRTAPKQPAVEASSADELLTALQQHLDTFGDSPTVDQAALWLASQQMARQEFESAARSLSRVATGSPSFSKAVGKYPDLIFALQVSKPGDRGSSNQTAQVLLEDLQRRLAALSATGQSIPPSVVDATIQVAMAAELMPAESLATWMRQNVIGSDSHSEPVLRGSAWYCLAETLAGDDSDTKPFADSLVALGNTGRSRMLKVLGRLTEASSDAAAQKRLKRVSLVVVDSAIDSMDGPKTDAKTDADKKALSRWRFQQAKLLRQSGETSAAIAILTELRAGGSRNQAVELEFARSLSQAQDEAGQVAAPTALTAWRKLAASLKPRSEAWYEAKWMVAKELVRADDAQAAAKMLRYLKSVYGWEESAFAQRLDSLLDSH